MAGQGSAIFNSGGNTGNLQHCGQCLENYPRETPLNGQANVDLDPASFPSYLSDENLLFKKN